MCLDKKRKVEVKVRPKPGLYRRTQFRIVMITKSCGHATIVVRVED